VRSPDAEPEEISNEREGNEEHQLHFVVLKTVIDKISLVGTYIILVPHQVKESIHGEVIVSTSEARESSDNGTRKEDIVNVLLSPVEYF
jgi:hypothetical protein